MRYYTVERLLSTGRVWTKDDFVFFWGHTDRGRGDVTKACLSQWHRCSFTVDGQYYNCAEQYMMAEKARIFNDEPIREQIMRETDQITIKKLGRRVSGFDGAIWEGERYDVVFKGNEAKFTQNPHLQEFLLGTGDKILVEASPKDTIWGIGLDEFNPDALDPRTWRGKNLLGFTLMDVRQRLCEEQAKQEMHARFVRYYETLAELHRMGYELFRVCPYISPNGMCYRCWLTIKKNTWKGCGAFFNEQRGDDQALYTPDCTLPWDDSGMTPRENAEKIIQEYPRLASNAHGSDYEYVEWFKLALDECRQGHYFYALAEYVNPLEKGFIPLIGVDGRGLPLPPPGDSDTQLVY